MARGHRPRTPKPNRPVSACRFEPSSDDERVEICPAETHVTVPKPRNLVRTAAEARIVGDASSALPAPFGGRGASPSQGWSPTGGGFPPCGSKNVSRRLPGEADEL